MEYEIKSSEFFSARQLNNAYYEMLLRLTGDMSVKQVVDYLSELLNSSVILYTRSGSHIFSSWDDSRARTSMLHLQYQLSEGDHLRNFFKEYQTSHVETEYPGVYLDHYAGSDNYALSGELIGPNGLLGTLCLLDVDFSSLSEQAETFKLFCRLLSQKLYKENPLNEMQQESSGIEQLDINNGAKWFRKLKGDVFQNFYIAVMDGSGITEQQIKLFKAELESSQLLFRMVVQEAFIIVLLNVRDNDEAAIMRAALNQFAKTHRLPIGLSHRFQGTEKIHDSFLQAADALSVARYLGLEECLFQFEQLTVDALLLDLMRTSSLDCYRNEGLDTLCLYDEQNGTQYYETLKCFISCGASKQKASQTLFIHRNTLAYRLERIEELLHVSLSDIDVQTRLYLDIKIREFLDHSTAI